MFCIPESIDDEFVALYTLHHMELLPHGVVSDVLVSLCIRNNPIITVCIAIDRLIYNIPAIKESVILPFAAFPK